MGTGPAGGASGRVLRWREGGFVPLPEPAWNYRTGTFEVGVVCRACGWLCNFPVVRVYRSAGGAVVRLAVAFKASCCPSCKVPGRQSVVDVHEAGEVRDGR